MAYLREMPVHSLNSGTLKAFAFVARPATRASWSIADVVKDQVVADAHQALFAQQDLQERAGARRLHAGFREHLGHRGHGQAGLFEGALDFARAPAPRPP